MSDESVLAGTLQVMARHGPAEFTLAAVAAKVGIAPPTLLQRFRDKRSLILAAVSHDNEGFAAAIHAAPRSRGRKAVVDLLLSLTPDIEDPEALATGLLWLGEDFRDPDLNALARERWQMLRAALVARMPTLSIRAELAAQLVEAQWQGAFNQWGFFREGPMPEFVASALEAWFDLAEPTQSGPQGA